MLGIAAIGVAAMGGTALAGHQASAVKSYTGCLKPVDGPITKIKEGNSPRSACSGGQVEVHFSGGDITAISVSGGLELGPNGGDNGHVEIGLKPGFSLPQGCAAGRVAEWDGSKWVCGDDNDTTYSAGTGLDLSAGNQFSINPAYRVTGKSCAQTNSFIRGYGPDGSPLCAEPASSTSAGYFSRLAGAQEISGTETVLSENLPAGNYLLFAHVVGTTPSFDDDASGRCDLASDSSGVSFSDDPLERDNANMTLMSGIVHAGGVVALTCTETGGNFDVASASLAAIQLDSIG